MNEEQKYRFDRVIRHYKKQEYNNCKKYLLNLIDEKISKNEDIVIDYISTGGPANSSSDKVSKIKERIPITIKNLELAEFKEYVEKYNSD